MAGEGFNTDDSHGTQQSSVLSLSPKARRYVIEGKCGDSIILIYKLKSRIVLGDVLTSPHLDPRLRLEALDKAECGSA